VAGIVGHSQAVLTDALHSLSDCTSDLAIIFGVRFWTVPADESHPYGHARIETLITVLVGLILIAAGLLMGARALKGMLAGDTPSPPTWVAIVASILALVSKEWLYRWTWRVGVRLRSSSVKANAWHHRSDAISTIPALFAATLAAVRPAWVFVDALGAVLVAAIILIAGWKVLKPALDVLVDRAGSVEQLGEIMRLSHAIPGVRQVHGVRSRQVGGGLGVDMHVHVDGDISVDRGHAIASSVKHSLMQDGPDVVDVVVHIEPED
ncbi:MAG: cation diffusion facilitator family transporter, partial [Kiritimatiellia bacterium]